MRSSIPATIEIREDIDTDVGSVLASATQIHQIVLNLCTNAYHAMRETGGVLSIELKNVEIEKTDSKVTSLKLAPGSYVMLNISDTGCGMDNATQQRIFEPYFTTKRIGDGTGMGLAIVHGIVKRLDGHISVYSELGKGTSFQIYLPKTVSETAKTAIEDTTEIPIGFEQILLVDDEETILRVEERMLTRLGYSVTAIPSSEEALKRFESNPRDFDLVITDMTMPHMNGVELSKKLLVIRSDIPIIMCTGFSEIINESKAKGIVIREFLMKPVARRDLATAIRKVLDG
jgi:CheY-like chemotaxis protein